MTIAVVDYGVNNLKSVVRALEAGGHEGTLTADPDEVRAADLVRVPGTSPPPAWARRSAKSPRRAGR